MKVVRTIEFNEQDVNNALLYAAERQLEGVDSDDIKVTYITGVRGDYDRANAEEFVKKAIIDVYESKK